jgi:hypothetical protein
MFDILIVFIVLKWTGAVDWSWGAVFIPFWIGLAMDVGLFVIDCWSAGTTQN